MASSPLPTSPPATPNSLLKYTAKALRKSNAALKQVAEMAFEEDPDLKEAAVELGKSMTKCRAGLKEAQKSVDAVKGTKRGGGGRGQAPKRMQIKPSAQHLAAMGDPNFLEQVREMYEEPALTFTAWFGHALDKSKATLSEDASLGFYLMARGIVPTPPDQLELGIGELLSIDIEDRLVESIDDTPVAQIGHRELWKIYKGSDPKDPRNQKHRVELFQHVVQCIEAVRFSLGWKSLTNDEDPNARQAVIREVYAIERAESDKPIPKDQADVHFTTFCGQFKNFRTGAKHIYDAYQVFGSIVLICPLMHVNAFHESRVGAAMNNVVKALSAVSVPGDFEEREKTHNDVLKAVLTALDGLVTTDKLTEMLNDMETEYFGSG